MTKPLADILRELESKQREWWIDELSGRFGPWEQIEDMTWPNDEGVIKVTDTPNLLPALKLAVEALLAIDRNYGSHTCQHDTLNTLLQITQLLQDGEK